MKTNMLRHRVLLVDDNADVRKAVRRLFHDDPNFEVVGEAEDGRDAVENAPRLRPDLIILDLSMPVMNGLEAALLLVKILPNAGLILFTAHGGPEIGHLSLAAGIHAVVSKATASTELIPKAEALMEGRLETA
jgi:DNA-binding NarL/FixJ family response regulator